MIKPCDFKRYCKKVFGDTNCTFTYADNSTEPYNLCCIVDKQEVANLAIYNSDLTTLCRVCLDGYEIIVNYNVTLYYYLLKVNKALKSVRQKLFKIYRTISTEFPDDNLHEVTKMTIKYLINVEYITEPNIQRLFKELFDSVCQNNPKITEELILDMVEFYTSKIKINNIKEI